jgi:hypothetical protein
VTKESQKVQHNNNNNSNNNNNAISAHGGDRKTSIPAINLDTDRDGRKGDPQHECCGKKCGLQQNGTNGKNEKMQK